MRSANSSRRLRPGEIYPVEGVIHRFIHSPSSRGTFDIALPGRRHTYTNAIENLAVGMPGENLSRRVIYVCKDCLAEERQTRAFLKEIARA